jgi:DNA repair exonuclease SbcCD ATPase subunit
MRQWKAAGRADRDTEAELWKRFRGAQDKFFNARSEVFSAKDAALRDHAEAKQQLLESAQALVPVADIRAAKSALRGIQERWEQIGAVPRDAREHLESGLRRVEEAVRKAEETQWRRSNPEALARAEGTVAQLRATIAQLEAQLASARERGDASAVSSAEEALTARRAWLEEAEHTLAEFSG